MKLITETIEDIEVLTEATSNGGKAYKIRGVFMQADIKNRNGRVYPVQTLCLPYFNDDSIVITCNKSFC